MYKQFYFPLLFVLSVCILSWLYDYPTELTLRPNSFHQWRQCDGAQIAMNYYNVSMNFFEPRLNLCTGNDGKMISELPIIYYAAACLYKVFGPHEYFIRLLSISIFFLGLFYLFKAITLLLNNRFYALLLSLIPFASPITSDYAFSFLPDVPALSFTFIAYYFLIKFFYTENTSAIKWSTAFFTLAGLLKVTSLIGFSAIGVILSAYFIFDRNNKWIAYKKHFLVFLVIPTVITGLWIAYAKYYNFSNHNIYFNLSIQPIWDTDEQLQHDVWVRFDRQWLRMSLYRDFIHSLPFLVLLSFLIPKTKAKPILFWLSTSLLGGAMYFFLFFCMFLHHDYYLICLMFIPVAVLTIFILCLKEWKEIIFNSWVTKTTLLTLITVMLYHGIRINRERSNGIKTAKFNEYWNIEPELAKLGIKENDKIISIGDETSGVSLYFMNRRGWTEMLKHTPLKKSFIDTCVLNGAKYMLVYKNYEADIDSAAHNSYTKHLIGEPNGIKVYKL
jgi:hypothetical protein